MDTPVCPVGDLHPGRRLVLAMVQNREGQLPYTAPVLAGLFFLTHGTYHKKCGLRLACRTAAASAEPYVLTLDEGKWNGRDTYCKWSGVPNGFGQSDPDRRRSPADLPPLLPHPAAGLPAVLHFVLGGGQPA